MTPRHIRELLLLAILMGGMQAEAVAVTYTLTVSKAGAATGNVGAGTITSNPAGISCGSTCGKAYESGTVVALTATPGAGSTFAGWSGACTGTGACTVTMTAAKSVTAKFGLITKTLNISRSGAGSGTVTSNPAGINCGGTCGKAYTLGSTVTLTAAPNAGATFVGWSGACGGNGACTLTINRNLAAEAIFAAPATTTYEYDANGNPTRTINALGHARSQGHDALDRPILVQEPSATVAGTTVGQIALAYDGQGRPTTVQDPRALKTAYSVDGLGNVTQETSPDRGTTKYTYDAAGNLKTRTDARGKTASYTYDAINRLTKIVHADQTITLTWDGCLNGIGRLCQIVDGTATTVYGYDAQGRVISKTETLGTLTRTSSQSYNAAGQLIGQTTPTGQVIAYDWADGRISAIRVNGQTLLMAVRHEPFGPVAGWNWGNGESVTRSHDLVGRPNAYTLGRDPTTGAPDTRELGYDAAGRIISNLAKADGDLRQTHGYDGLDRLVGSQIGAQTLSYAYDLAGNRTSRSINGVATANTVAPASNRLTAIGAQAQTYDVAGNLTREGTVGTHTYDAAGRRIASSYNGASSTHAYNALGQRLKKTVGSNVRLYAYDEAGRLLGETDGAGKLIQETVWLGEIPVATLRLPAGASGGVAEVYYVHADHLNTPRRITRPSDNQVMWQWESEAFGNSMPNENPQGAGAFSYNLRFPGQYFDVETELNYNYFRDYDPTTGRYVQSDPIGLAGGINTYTYVNGNPIGYTDPRGLNPAAGAVAGGMVGGPVGAVIGGVIGFGAGLAIGNWIFNQPEVDPVPAQQPFNPGRDCNGKCNPCPPPIYWDAPGNKHGSSSGTHAHGIVWNQDPSTCMCYPRRVSGPSFGNTR